MGQDNHSKNTQNNSYKDAKKIFFWKSFAGVLAGISSMVIAGLLLMGPEIFSDKPKQETVSDIQVAKHERAQNHLPVQRQEKDLRSEEINRLIDQMALLNDEIRQLRTAVNEPVTTQSVQAQRSINRPDDQNYAHYENLAPTETQAQIAKTDPELHKLEQIIRAYYQNIEQTDPRTGEPTNNINIDDTVNLAQNLWSTSRLGETLSASDLITLTGNDLTAILIFAAFQHMASGEAITLNNIENSFEKALPTQWKGIYYSIKEKYPGPMLDRLPKKQTFPSINFD